MLGLPPLSYNLRSLFVRKSSTLLTVVGIGATVAVLAGILALQQGFASLYGNAGRDDVAVFLRKGATSEGESDFPRERARILMKETPEIATGANGQPLASGEIYLAVRLPKFDGGETNVPIRGVEPASIEIAGEGLRVVEGRLFEPGADEVIVGQALARRLQAASVDDIVQLNTTPFRVVGIFAYDGPFQSEIWGDVDRMGEALERPNFNRIVARLRPEADLVGLAERLVDDKRVPTKVMSESAYLSGQTAMLSGVLVVLGILLAVIMGIGAVFTGTNTMLSALASRSHEIGVLLSIGFRPVPVFISFLFEACVLGLLGGIAGCLLVLPLHGLDTGTTNFQTFTEVAFSFRVTPVVLIVAVVFAVVLGFIGGLIPALMAALKNPVDALRHK